MSARLRLRAAALVSALALLTTGMTGALSDAAHADTADLLRASVSADPLPTVQINGVVWAQTVVGNTVYVTGSFTSARPAGAPAGTGEQAVGHLLAYDIRTGERISTFAATLNAQGRAIAASPDGRRIYVGGEFTTANGVARNRLAAFDAATGELVAGFAPSISNRVSALAVGKDVVYAGGAFFQANGVTRTRLAAFTTTGAVLPWRPKADDQEVLALALGPDGSRLYVGGKFATLNGAAAPGVGAVLTSTGETVPVPTNTVIRNSGTSSGITSLKADGGRIVGTAFKFGGATGNFEGAFAMDAATGALVWIDDCHGDTYDSFQLGASVYVAGHAHYCNNLNTFPQTTSGAWNFQRLQAFTVDAHQNLGREQLGYGNFEGHPAPLAQDFWPFLEAGTFTGQGQAAWSLAGNGAFVSVGGEFPVVGTIQQQGLVRFAVRSAAPRQVGPEWSEALRPVLAPAPGGGVRVQWTATTDDDDGVLTYQVIRDGDRANPVFSTSVRSSRWHKPALGFTDPAPQPGSTVAYRVHAVDSDGNVLPSFSASITVPEPQGAMTTYAGAVLADRPTAYWRFGAGGAAGQTDLAGGSPLQLGAGTAPAAGALPGDPDATAFDGTAAAIGTTANKLEAPTSFTVSAWIRTTSTSPGRVAGFSTEPAATSNTRYTDRLLYLGSTGRIHFGTNPQQGRRTISSPTPVNDGKWHQVVGTFSPESGMRLYVDGRRVAEDPSARFSRFYAGHWRVGADTLSGWPTTTGALPSFLGDIDDVAVFGTALGGDRVHAHWLAAGGAAVLPEGPPTDAFGTATMALQPSLVWRFDEPSGTAVVDGSGNGANARLDGGARLGATGAPGTSGAAAAFDGSNDVAIATATTVAPGTFSAGAWVRTTSTRGGKIFGFGSALSGLSSTYDRHVWLTKAGRLSFGLYNGSQVSITTDTPVNDGEWHYVVATAGPAGMRLYVDGALAAGRDGSVAANSYSGAWRVGGDRVWGDANTYLAADIDEFAVWPQVVSLKQVQDLLASAGAAPPNGAPVASFSGAAAGLTVELDGSASADADGTVVWYDWDPGDGSAPVRTTAPTHAHTYQASGTWTVRLTVTDDDGGTATAEQQVTTVAPPPNVAPTASFATAGNELEVHFDATGSTDEDGTIARYRWDFGDGSAAVDTSAPTTSWRYAAASSYPVTLTVVDDQGAEGTTTGTAVAVAPDFAALDRFDRSVTNGLGSAVVGGAWSLVGSTSRFAVADGAAMLRHTAGGQQDEAWLPAATAAGTDLRVALSTDAAASGGGTTVSVTGRRVDALNRYDARLRWLNGNTWSVALAANKGATTTTLLSSEVPVGGVFAPGERLQIRLQVVGSGPTTVRVKVWRQGQPEPAGWLIERVDSHPALQASGHVGFVTYLSASATTVPLAVRFADYEVRRLLE
jgi:hypothetical protein